MPRPTRRRAAGEGRGSSSGDTTNTAERVRSPSAVAAAAASLLGLRARRSPVLRSLEAAPSCRLDSPATELGWIRVALPALSGCGGAGGGKLMSTASSGTPFWRPLGGFILGFALRRRRAVRWHHHGCLWPAKPSIVPSSRCAGGRCVDPLDPPHHPLARHRRIPETAIVSWARVIYILLYTPREPKRVDPLLVPRRPQTNLVAADLAGHSGVVILPAALPRILLRLRSRWRSNWPASSPDRNGAAHSGLGALIWFAKDWGNLSPVPGVDGGRSPSPWRCGASPTNRAPPAAVGTAPARLDGCISTAGPRRPSFPPAAKG